MKNAKHIGCMWALAVALGVGMAVASTPAVASAAPADSGTGSSSGGSSPSSSSRHSGSTSSDAPSAKNALAATNDAPRRHRRLLNPPGETAVSSSGGAQTSTTTGSSGRAGTRAALETPDTDARPRRGATSHPGSGSTLSKTGPNPAVVNAAAHPARDSRLDITRPAAGVSSFASTTPSASATPADAVPRLVSTVLNEVLSPFANSAPTAPVQPPAALTLLAFARREFEPASTTVNPLAGQVTSSAVDPGFISSTHNFGLFSVTSAADPDDNHYVAFVLQTPFFTNVLTSGTDPEDNLGFGAASIGVAGQTVNTFISPFLNFSIAIPIEDPFAALFIELVRLGF